MYVIIILALIQAISEFLPISSSGHLALFGSLLDKSNPYLDASLHLGTALALLVFLRQEVMEVIRDLRKLFGLALATLPVLGVAYLLKDQIEWLHQDQRVLWVVMVGLIFGTLLLWLADYRGVKAKGQLRWPTLRQACLVGLGQISSLWPGVSRSGSSTATAVLTGLDLVSSAKFSFLTAIPITLIVGGYSLLDLGSTQSQYSYPQLLAGVGITAISGYFILRYLIKYLARHNLRVFIYYRLFLIFVLGLMIVLK
ncbi:undecaprenyl-diphosphate phosphatase [Candidatus Nomurabacteria bacterium]|nr:undecaprenyl-diphosphate phosphatase [Candidatus Nomurabacteria bacterium]